MICPSFVACFSLRDAVAWLRQNGWDATAEHASKRLWSLLQHGALRYVCLAERSIPSSPPPSHSKIMSAEEGRGGARPRGGSGDARGDTGAAAASSAPSPLNHFAATQGVFCFVGPWEVEALCSAGGAKTSTGSAYTLDMSSDGMQVLEYPCCSLFCSIISILTEYFYCNIHTY
jgi:hypothetical protein